MVGCGLWRVEVRMHGGIAEVYMMPASGGWTRTVGSRVVSLMGINGWLSLDEMRMYG